MAKKIIIAGIKRKGDFILRFRGSNTFHRVPAKSLLEAKAKMLKGSRHTFQDVQEISPTMKRRLRK